MRACARAFHEWQKEVPPVAFSGLRSTVPVPSANGRRKGKTVRRNASCTTADSGKQNQPMTVSVHGIAGPEKTPQPRVLKRGNRVCYWISRPSGSYVGLAPTCSTRFFQLSPRK